MVYSTNDDFGRRRGYDDWNSFVDKNGIPSALGLSGARIQANTFLNMDYHNKSTDTTNAEHTGYMREMEVVVIERILDNARGRDQPDLKIPIRPIISRDEKETLGTLGGKRKHIQIHSPSKREVKI